MAFQSKEIESSRIHTGEEEALREERKVLTHAQKLMTFAQTSEEMLYGREVQLLIRFGRSSIRGERWQRSIPPFPRR